MAGLFDFWSTDESKKRESILFERNKAVSEPSILNNIINKEWNVLPQSNPDSNDLKQATFWNSFTDYFGKVLTDAKAVLKMKDSTTLGKIWAGVDDTIKYPVNQSVDILKTIPEKTKAAADFLKSGLFKIIIYILIAVVLFFFLRAFAMKQGARFT